jgi:enoyl-CoA hydratase
MPARSIAGVLVTVRLERSGRVLTVILSRPDVRNAVDPEHADALQAAFLEFDRDQDVDVAVLWGEGGAFCAGADLKSLARRGIATAANRATHRSLEYPEDGSPPPRGPLGPTRLFLDKPVIAAVEGPAVAGGMELALWADLRVMAADAYFGVYCRRWGVPLSDGGTVRLPRIVGRGRALEIILTGRAVPASESLQLGLCEQVVPRGRARSAAEELAQRIAAFPQACVRADRRSVYLQDGLAEQDALRREWDNCAGVFKATGADGVSRFASGAGRHGEPDS